MACVITFPHLIRRICRTRLLPLEKSRTEVAYEKILADIAVDVVAALTVYAAAQQQTQAGVRLIAGAAEALGGKERNLGVRQSSRGLWRAAYMTEAAISGFSRCAAKMDQHTGISKYGGPRTQAHAPAAA